MNLDDLAGRLLLLLPFISVVQLIQSQTSLLSAIVSKSHQNSVSHMSRPSNHEVVDGARAFISSARLGRGREGQQSQLTLQRPESASLLQHITNTGATFGET